MFCMMNVNGICLPHPAFRSVTVDKGSIMISAMSFVTTMDRTNVTATSIITAVRQLDKWATNRRASASNAPTLRNADTMARMDRRHASTLRSK